MELCAFVVLPGANLSKTLQLQAKDNFIDIDLMGIAEKNSGEAAVVFVTYSNMERALGPNLFSTEGDTVKTMMSSVVSASLPMTPNAELTAPVNFTLKHTSVFVNNSELTCVYWNRSAWVIDGCSVSESNATHTVCTCSHLSTFALIMQTERPREDNSFIKLLGTVGISVGLVFLALTLLTFICCHWNPKVNNTARLNLCLCLFLAHLLFQLVQTFLSQIRQCQLACAVVSGVLHYLFLASFVWMNLEALQLFLLVRNLRDVKVIKKEGLHWGLLLFVGYGFPCLVVMVSAAVFPEGYGNEECWLKTEKGFRWSFLAPAGYVLACNSILFMGIIGYLSATFADLHSDISQMRDTRIMVLKAMLQFFILGCSWILGFLASDSRILELLFLFFSSQQGTFIFIVHCALNKEVQVQYRRWLEKFCFSKEILDYTSTSMSSTASVTVKNP
ncbi:adhesion G protein-coupled receptor E3-like [Scleropages formosus]|uniref:adhesion G protein-coupled receptor E3-like n=1 Tax=Scleropages formosus TaxID=113540 RepID=UPI0010FA7757|nr:adhesion G protein-coupled receptor E3-like [Scleropages formosus]